VKPVHRSVTVFIWAAAACSLTLVAGGIYSSVRGYPNPLDAPEPWNELWLADGIACLVLASLAALLLAGDS
jgi:hypothetical protein